jgi:hypothetical protein
MNLLPSSRVNGTTAQRNFPAGGATWFLSGEARGKLWKVAFSLGKIVFFA